MANKMKILGIETSCDETSVAIVEAKGNLSNLSFEILSNIVLSQIKIHAHWGGVVPMMAKREHSKNLIAILEKSLKKSSFLKLNLKSPLAYSGTNIKNKLDKILEREPELLKQFLDFIPTIKPPKIDVIAVTVGPGLEPALWVGINFAKTLAMVWNKPIVGVNHMEGHIAAVLLQNGRSTKHEARSTKKSFGFPAMALLVSGGHTELVLIKKWGDYKIIGETRDDAAGECFDKTARMLGLPYPGGPEIAKLASRFKSKARSMKFETNLKLKIQNSKIEIKLPRPMINSKDSDFSFSGLKTAVLYMLRDMKERHMNTDDYKPAICHEIQQAIIDVLVAKTIRATKEFNAQSIILGGGVAANKELRHQIKKAVKELTPTALYLPPAKLTTDNAAMIAAAGYLHVLNKDFIEPEKLAAKGNLALK